MTWESSLLIPFPIDPLTAYADDTALYHTAGGSEGALEFGERDHLGYIQSTGEDLIQPALVSTTPRLSKAINSIAFSNLSTNSPVFSTSTTPPGFAFNCSPSIIHGSPLSAPLQRSSQTYNPRDGPLSAFANPATAKGEGSWFASMQDSYLQHHSTSSPQARHSPENYSHLHRSPGEGYSPVSSPRLIPSHSSYGTSPMSSTGARRGSIVPSLASPIRRPPTTGSFSGQGMSTRRPSRLSIAVPPVPGSFDLRNSGRHTPPIISYGAISTDVDSLLGAIGELGATLSPPSTPTSRTKISPFLASNMSSPLASNLEGQPMTAPSITFEGNDFALHDMELLEASEQHGTSAFNARAYPASAPAWQTTFNLPNQYEFQPQSLLQSLSATSYSGYSIDGPQPSYSAYTPYSYTSSQLLSTEPSALPFNYPDRPRSAPGDVILPNSPALMERRRGSSVDMVPAMKLLVNPFDSITAPPQMQLASGSGITAPIHLSFPSPLSDIAPPPNTPPKVFKTPKKEKKPSSPVKTPKSNKSLKRQAGGTVMFVNFTALDSQQLLSGVAPSGSNKKRQRDSNTVEGSPSRSRTK